VTSRPRHTRAASRDHDERRVGVIGAGDRLDALDLGRPERWVLSQVHQRGVAGFVVQMTIISVVASLGLVTALMLALYGPDDPTLLPGMAMGAIVPAIVAPPVLVFSVRLTAALDRASLLLWDTARTDPLTDVANRRAFFDVVDGGGVLADQALDVAVVDLDAFKSINDRYGHSGGDLALQQVARWLVGLAGDDGLVARLGGDEFAVVLPADDGAERPTSTAFEHDGMRYSVTLGWARRDAGDSLDAALRIADLELYARKPTTTTDTTDLTTGSSSSGAMRSR
jgi:diguanylate cyclase (GGDEF)-like protein